MTKLLIILILIAVALLIIATRYRRQIQTGIYLWRTFKRMRQVGRVEEKQVESKVNSGDIPLVRCARCGTWTPQSKALSLGGKTFYCSTACVETAVKIA